MASDMNNDGRPSRAAIELLALGLIALVVAAAIRSEKRSKAIATRASHDALIEASRISRPPWRCGAIIDRNGCTIARFSRAAGKRIFAKDAQHIGTLLGLDWVADGVIAQQRTWQPGTQRSKFFSVFLGDPIWSAGPAPDLRLSIDLALSAAAHRALMDTGRPGCVLVVDNTGEVWALVQVPSLDIHHAPAPIEKRLSVQGRKDSPRPLWPAWKWVCTPGSVIKPFIAAVAIQLNLPPPPVYCTGRCIGFGRPLRCWKAHGAVQTYAEAISRSCDTFFYQLSRYADLSGSVLQEYAKRAGLTTPPLYRAGAGQANLKSWSAPPGSEKRALSFIGQGITLSPFGVASFTAAVLWEKIPRWSWILAEGGSRVSSGAQDSPFDSEVRGKVRTAMRLAVLRGTARGLQVIDWEVVAKTGTAEMSNKACDRWVVAEFGSGHRRFIVVTLVKASTTPSIAKRVTKTVIAAVRRRTDRRPAQLSLNSEDSGR